MKESPAETKDFFRKLLTKGLSPLPEEDPPLFIQLANGHIITPEWIAEKHDNVREDPQAQFERLINGFLFFQREASLILGYLVAGKTPPKDRLQDIERLTNPFRFRLPWPLNDSHDRLSYLVIQTAKDLLAFLERDRDKSLKICRGMRRYGKGHKSMTHCGRFFIARRSNQTYCSPSCKKNHANWLAVKTGKAAEAQKRYRDPESPLRKKQKHTLV